MSDEERTYTLDEVMERVRTRTLWDNVKEYGFLWFLSLVWKRTGDKFFYWLRCHLWTRYHILDLRNDCGIPYRWGWIDRCTSIEIAMYRILEDFFEEEHPERVIVTSWTAEEAAAEQLGEEWALKQTADWNELKELYQWWKVGLKAAQDRDDELTHLWHESRWGENPEPKEVQERRWDELVRYGEWFNAERERRLIRLVQLRGHLWT